MTVCRLVVENILSYFKYIFLPLLRHSVESLFQNGKQQGKGEPLKEQLTPIIFFVFGPS